MFGTYLNIKNQRARKCPHFKCTVLILNLYQVAVQQLYEFRDHYFEHNSTDKALLKNQETQEKLKETLNMLDYVQGKKTLDYIASRGQLRKLSCKIIIFNV